ncbi:MAG: septal ring lytic transglycosylase RlpA family protein [Bryobacterales bacterium]|nr:septal ring lytic transglycosylase RlpA family protein [Bryobacteraceae bacterium]MDW8353295.1 septal ring lytic transglycosylase RlpA family protein [Bryobacterales bacterium]
MEPSARITRRSLGAALAALLAACARKKRPPVPAAPAPGWTETGIASWYGRPYHGRRTASGEIYDMEQLTAAHRTLPFGTWVHVRNLDNRRAVVVRINDRGPFVEGRIVDLSRAAARRLAMIGPGTARVRLEVIAPAAPPERGPFGVQVGAFRDRANAERARDRARRFGESRLVFRDGDPPVWRVIVGREPSLDSARVLADRLRVAFGEAFVVRLDEIGADGL